MFPLNSRLFIKATLAMRPSLHPLSELIYPSREAERPSRTRSIFPRKIAPSVRPSVCPSRRVQCRRSEREGRTEKGGLKRGGARAGGREKEPPLQELLSQIKSDTDAPTYCARASERGARMETGSPSRPPKRPENGYIFLCGMHIR